MAASALQMFLDILTFMQKLMWKSTKQKQKQRFFRFSLSSHAWMTLSRLPFLSFFSLRLFHNCSSSLHVMQKKSRLSSYYFISRLTESIVSSLIQKLNALFNLFVIVIIDFSSGLVWRMWDNFCKYRFRFENGKRHLSNSEVSVVERNTSSSGQH